MSNKKHKGDHNLRAERRAAEKNQAPLKNPAKMGKSHRVFLRNPYYIWATLGIVLACVAVITAVGVLGWWENVIVSIVTILVGAFGCMCVYDLGLLITACITFGEGMVNAGKNEQGHQMVFHAASVTRLEMRDKDGRVLPEDAPVYKNAEIAFVMESGRVNGRKVSRLTAKQYARVKAALESEKNYKEAP